MSVFVPAPLLPGTSRIPPTLYNRTEWPLRAPNQAAQSNIARSLVISLCDTMIDRTTILGWWKHYSHSLACMLARQTKNRELFFIFFFNQFWFNLFLLYCLCSMVTTGPVSRQICRCLILYTFYLLLSSIHSFVHSSSSLTTHNNPYRNNTTYDQTTRFCGHGGENFVKQINCKQNPENTHRHTRTDTSKPNIHQSNPNSKEPFGLLSVSSASKQANKHKTDSLDDTPTATTTATSTSKQ